MRKSFQPIEKQAGRDLLLGSIWLVQSCNVTQYREKASHLGKNGTSTSLCCCRRQKGRKAMADLIFRVSDPIPGGQIGRSRGRG